MDTDDRYGTPPPATPDMRDTVCVMAVQMMVVVVLSCAFHPSVMCVPGTTRLSIPLVLLLAVSSLFVTVLVQRSFVPSKK